MSASQRHLVTPGVDMSFPGRQGLMNQSERVTSGSDPRWTDASEADPISSGGRKGAGVGSLGIW